MTRPSRQALAAALGIAAVGTVAYLPVLSNGFVYDDHGLVLERAARSSLAAIWSGAAYPDYWPLTWSVLWAAWRVWGAWAPGYHLLNLALHLASAVLLWRALRAIHVPGAWIAGLLFAIHPVTVESAAWVSELKNTLSAPLYLGAFLAWRRADAEERSGPLLASAALFAAALLAKTSTVMLPVVLLGACLYLRGRVAWRDLAQAAPHLALAAVAGMLTIWFQHQRSITEEWLPARGAAERIAGAGWAFLTYLRTAFVPVRLGFVHADFPRDPAVLAWAGAAGSAALLALLWAFRSSWGRPALYAVGYQLLLVLPVLGLVDIAYLRVGPASNHLQYLALMGPVALGGAGLAWLISRWQRIGKAAAAVLSAALAAATWTRAASFRDDVSLWTAAVAAAPRSFLARWELARALALRDRYAEAEATLREAAAALDPAGRHRARSLLALGAGRYPEVVSEAWRAEDLRPEPAFLLYVGRQLIDAGAPREAVGVLEPLARRIPRGVEVRAWLGVALARSGRPDDALRVLSEASRIAPGNEDVLRAMAELGAEPGAR